MAIVPCIPGTVFEERKKEKKEKGCSSEDTCAHIQPEWFCLFWCWSVKDVGGVDLLTCVHTCSTCLTPYQMPERKSSSTKSSSSIWTTDNLFFLLVFVFISIGSSSSSLLLLLREAPSSFERSTLSPTTSSSHLDSPLFFANNSESELMKENNSVIYSSHLDSPILNKKNNTMRQFDALMHWCTFFFQRKTKS